MRTLGGSRFSKANAGSAKVGQEIERLKNELKAASISWRRIYKKQSLKMLKGIDIKLCLKSGLAAISFCVQDFL
jgi:hypothetical protein